MEFYFQLNLSRTDFGAWAAHIPICKGGGIRHAAEIKKPQKILCGLLPLLVKNCLSDTNKIFRFYNNMIQDNLCCLVRANGLTFFH